MNESDLIQRLKAGDSAAFEHIVRAFGPRMLAVAKRLLNSDEEAADAVQEAFVSAWKSIDRFEGGSLLSTWLHRITVNSALMRIRSRKRRNETGVHDIESLLPKYDADGHRHNPRAAWESSAEAILQSAEMRQMIRDKINMLPDDYRTVIMLRDIEELDTDAAAEALGISAGAVKTRLHRARMALRHLLEGELA